MYICRINDTRVFLNDMIRNILQLYDYFIAPTTYMYMYRINKIFILLFHNWNISSFFVYM